MFFFFFCFFERKKNDQFFVEYFTEENSLSLLYMRDFIEYAVTGARRREITLMIIIYIYSLYAI